MEQCLASLQVRPVQTRQTDQDPDSPVPSYIQDVSVDGSGPPTSYTDPSSSSGSMDVVGSPFTYINSIVSNPSVSTPSISTPPVSTPHSAPPTLIPPHPTLCTMLEHAARARGSPVQA
ncbi:hypothetical protein QYF36_004527 [Acer negundo]|nr:hypothetical protein QYF36_004527 [Acer negundo]